MQIRLIKEDDAGLLVPVFDAYRQFYEQPSNEADARGYLEARLFASDCFGVVAINGDGKAAGFGLVYPTWSSVRMAPVWVLNDFYVVPDARGSDLASDLMEALFSHARQRGVGQISLITHETNVRAQALYRKTGWKQSEFLRFEKLL